MARVNEDRVERGLLVLAGQRSGLGGSRATLDMALARARRRSRLALAALLASSGAAAAAAVAWDRIGLRVKADGRDLGAHEVTTDAGGAGVFELATPPASRFEFELEDSDAAYVLFDIVQEGGVARVEVQELDQLPVDPERAAQSYAELRELSARDGGELWGTTLDGPVLFVDPATRFCVANEPDPGGQLLRPRGDVFAGRYPTDRGVANTAVDWAGKRWTMLLWPLPESKAERAVLLAHEAFHRVQPELGLWVAAAPCAHLDELRGRLWLRLEARALARALEVDGNERRGAAADALLFRQTRNVDRPDDARAERLLELLEGTAEDTGIALVHTDPAARRKAARSAIGRLDAEDPLVRTFAYRTGPAYGALLDELGAEGWRARLEASRGPADLLAERLDESLLPPEGARKRATAYGYDEVLREETAREELRAARRAELVARFVEGPVLGLSPSAPELTFDPGGVESLAGYGSYYPTLWMRDVWGELDVEGGVLVGPDMRVFLEAPFENEGGTLRGEGWSLALAPGWRIVRDGESWRAKPPE